MIGLGVLFIAALTAASVYLMLSPNVQRVTLGFVGLSNAANLILLIASGLPGDAVAPLLDGIEDGTPTDPLPQAFILTAIVIGLGNAAYLVGLAARTHREVGSDELPGTGGGR